MKYKIYILITIFFLFGILVGIFLYRYLPKIQVRLIDKKAEILKGESYVINYPDTLTFKQEEKSVPQKSLPIKEIHKDIQFPKLSEETTKYINAIWNTSGHDAKRTGRSPFSCSGSDNIKWSFRTMGIISSSSSIGSDGTIYVGSFDNNIYAIKPNGTLKWHFRTGSTILSSPTVLVNGTIYVGSNDNNFYAINSDGTLKWTFTTEDNILTSAAIDNDDNIYFGSNDGKLYALTPSGFLKWKFATKGSITGSPAVGNDGTIFIGSGDGFLYALEKNGRMKWFYKTSGAIKSSPVIDNDENIYVGSEDGYFYAINHDGSLRWRYFIKNPIRSSAAIDKDGTLFFGSSSDVYLYALSSNGNLKWKFKVDAPVVVQPAISDNGIIFFGSSTGTFYAVATNGKPLWKQYLGLFQGSPSIGNDGTVYVGSMLHKLIAIGPPMPTVMITINKSHFSKDINDALRIEIDVNASIYRETDVKVWIQFPDGVNRILDSFSLSNDKKWIRKIYTYNFIKNDLSGLYRVSAGIFDKVTGEQFIGEAVSLNVR